MTRANRLRGFTLLELVVALTLLALMASILFGALGYAGRSWEGGEAKVESTAAMRLSHGFLRAQLESQHPMRMRKMPDYPLLFSGGLDELRFAAALPEFDKSERSILADDIKELRVGYFGYETLAARTTAPTWRERWDDPHRLPLLIRIDVVPKAGAAWPTLLVAPRQAPEAGCRQWDPNGERCVGMR